MELMLSGSWLFIDSNSASPGPAGISCDGDVWPMGRTMHPLFAHRISLLASAVVVQEGCLGRGPKLKNGFLQLGNRGA